MGDQYVGLEGCHEEEGVGHVELVGRLTDVDGFGMASGELNS